MATSFYEIMGILEMGLKPDGKSFYSNEEKAELLQELFDRGVDDAFEAGFDKGWDEGHSQGIMSS